MYKHDLKQDFEEIKLLSFGKNANQEKYDLLFKWELLLHQVKYFSPGKREGTASVQSHFIGIGELSLDLKAQLSIEKHHYWSDVILFSLTKDLVGNDRTSFGGIEPSPPAGG